MPPRSWPDQPEQHPDRRGLAEAVRAEEPIDPPAWHQHVDGVDRDLLMEPLGQPMRGNREITQILGHSLGHLAARAAYRPSGVTAPTTSRPSSVSSAENTAPANRCPEPRLPETLGSSP